MLNRAHEKPEYFIAGYWVVDWKGVANYQRVCEIVNFRYKSWIVFRDTFEQQERYPAVQNNYYVYQIVLGARDETKMQEIYQNIKDLMPIRDWFVLSKKPKRQLGSFYPVNNNYFELIEPHLRYKAEHNEKVAAGQPLKLERKPQHFLAGYWVVDWKGAFNYDIIKEFVQYEWDSWIWFWHVGAEYSKVQAGYNVDKIIIGSDNFEDIEKIRDGLARFITIQDWHIPTESELDFLQLGDDMMRLGRIDWNVVGFGTSPDLPTRNYASARYNEDLAAGRKPQRIAWE